MPRGYPITDEQRERIYHLHTMNVDHKSIAEQFQIGVSTVSKCVRKQRELEQERRERKVAEIVIAGDRKNGRLVSVGTDRYEGSCLIDGRMKKKTFTAPNGKKATEQWEQWCQGLRDEQQFMDMVERKNEQSEPEPEPVDITPAPVPDIPVRPWREVAEERQRRIEELERELEEAKTQRVEFAEGYQMELHNPAYLIWAKRPALRCYGLFRTMEDALSELDRLNEVAVFLGGESVFEVEEVAWK